MEGAPPTSKCWASHLQAPPTQCPFCKTGHSRWGSTSVCRCFEPLSAMFILCLLSCSLTGCWYTSTAGPQRASMQKDMWCVTSDKPETCMQPSESLWQKMTFSSYLPQKLRSDFPEALGLRIDKERKMSNPPGKSDSGKNASWFVPFFLFFEPDPSWLVV